MEKSEREEIIDKVQQKNTVEYNLLKAGEEFQELALVLTQKALKPTKVNDQEIIDEIGDCIIRLKMIRKMYDKESVKKRVIFKLTKYKEWLADNRYINI